MTKINKSISASMSGRNQCRKYKSGSKREPVDPRKVDWVGKGLDEPLGSPSAQKFFQLALKYGPIIPNGKELDADDDEEQE